MPSFFIYIRNIDLVTAYFLNMIYTVSGVVWSLLDSLPHCLFSKGGISMKRYFIAAILSCMMTVSTSTVAVAGDTGDTIATIAGVWFGSNLLDAIFQPRGVTTVSHGRVYYPNRFYYSSNQRYYMPPPVYVPRATQVVRVSCPFGYAHHGQYNAYGQPLCYPIH